MIDFFVHVYLGLDGQRTRLRQTWAILRQRMSSLDRGLNGRRMDEPRRSVLGAIEN